MGWLPDELQELSEVGEIAFGKIKAQKSETYHAYINFEKYEGEKGGGREREEGRGRRQNVN